MTKLAANLTMLYNVRLPYDGWIGCEYKPKGKTEEGLPWRAAHGT